MLRGSNFYGTLPVLDGEEIGFGQGVMWAEEDFEDLVRFRLSTAGEYVLANDERGVVNTFGRKIYMQIKQIVDKFDEDHVSDLIKLASEKTPYEWYQVCHFVERNTKIWFAIFLLASYPKVRSGEIISVNEENIDLNLGIMTVPKTKVEPKRLYLLDEDIAFIKSCQRGLPSMPFFRHIPGRKGVSKRHYSKNGGRFGKDYLWKWWGLAGVNLGVEGVPIYPGTKHSTTTGALEFMTPDEVRTYTEL